MKKAVKYALVAGAVVVGVVVAKGLISTAVTIAVVGGVAYAGYKVLQKFKAEKKQEYVNNKQSETQNPRVNRGPLSDSQKTERDFMFTSGNNKH